MLAIRKTKAGPGGLSVDDVAAPKEAQSTDVLVKVEAAGICGTDLLIYKWGEFAKRMKLPTILGHEVSGVIEQVGSDVKGLRPGMRVSLESHLPCGTCYTCRRGWAHVCPKTRYPGVDFDGGFASFVVVPESVCWPVPCGIPPLQAAMMEPFGLAVHASLEGSGVSGLNVLVSGCGPIGLMNIAAAKALGASKVIATDIHPLRLTAAAKMGADECINATEESVYKTVRSLLGERGVDVAIDYSGQAAALKELIQSITHGGELRLMGVPSHDILLNLEEWLFKGLIVRGLHGRRLYETWERSTSLLVTGRVDLSSLVSHRLPLSAAEDAFEMALNGQSLKILFEPNGSCI
ncbi:L-threonine 3-dehydrogenase [Pseudomonas alloputida]|uniref:L-threonine 3-dehydrogenase n=1 Tax=Pseudomonas alloputida TaxID=1940621 RepID=A0ABY3CXX7_9PSED|nr:L-threonine 3-dehydrogenase [Pseudomonas alloputida]